MSAVMLASVPVASLQAANESYIIPYTGNYDKASYPQQNANAAFTGDDIVVDGVLESAYSETSVYEIANQKFTGAYEYAEGEETRGELRVLWDGPVMYLGVTVFDKNVVNTTTTPAGGMGSNPALPENMDSIEFGIDLYNDKVGYETDTIGAFTIGADGNLYYFMNANIPSLGCVMADPNHPEFQNRIHSYASNLLYAEDGSTVIGYVTELAIQLEGLDADNGTTLGVDVKINDINKVEVDVEEDSPEGTVTTLENPEEEELIEEEPTEEELTEEELEAQDVEEEQPQEEEQPREPVYEFVNAGSVFWSHNQDSYYTSWSHERPNSVDWGNVTLVGREESDVFAYSDWRLTNAIRYLDSLAFPKGVYTSASQSNLDTARAAAEAILSSGVKDKAATDAAAQRLEDAIDGLRWADTRYPDPDELPNQMTLPNTYKFFGSDRVVMNEDDWKERREQILDMAQFYEYGYKPGAPDNVTIGRVRHYNIGDKRTVLLWGFWPMEIEVTNPTDKIRLDITVGETMESMEFLIYHPTQQQLEAAGRTAGEVPILLSFDGSSDVYLNEGIAVVEVPAGSDGDSRSNEYAWGTRGGIFYKLYPYSRNGEGALREVSSEMAAAWSATRVIDALEAMKVSEVEAELSAVADVDPEKLAVSGFSINGKYAFVSAVFDERIDVCIPNAAGASGPSPWRYVYTGHEYDWSGTLFAPSDPSVSAKQISSGTEMMANSIRHNRVREIELFRQFLNPGNFYERMPGAYGFGTRLPYDQNDLVATLAPRAIVLENTVNDYNDGCEADSLGLQIAKSVYRNLGYDADELVKFNQRPAMPGDPHGSDDAQKRRTAEYLNYYFFGEEMSEETGNWLSTDPFALPVSNGKTQNPYDYYYGGFNTITGGTGGVNGRDGWYYHTFEKGDTSMDNNIDEDAPQTTLTGENEAILSAILSKEEQRLVKSGTDVSVALNVDAIDETVSEEDKNAVAQKLGGKNVATYLDINITKKIGAGPATEITELNAPVNITVKIPTEYLNTDNAKTRIYSVIHVHGGQAEVINGTFDAATQSFTFATDSFSTYALVYQDVDKSSSGSHDSDDSSNNNSSKDAQSEAAKARVKDKLPKMGEESHAARLAAIMLLCCVCAAVLDNRRKQDEKDAWK